jgi:hypothetical protein
MTLTHKNKLLFKSVINKFTEIIYISDDELQLMLEFVFFKSSDSNFLSDESEIYETLSYLRDVVQEANYLTVEELADYFEHQETTLTKLIEPLISTKPNILSANIFGLCSGSFKTDAMKGFIRGSFPETHKTSYQDIIQNLYYKFHSQESDNQLQLRKLNLSLSSERKGLFLKESNILINKSCCHYHNNSSELFQNPSFYNQHVSFIQKLRHSVYNFLSDKVESVAKFLFPKKRQRQKIDLLYQKVFESMYSERLGSNNQLKAMVTKIMLLSKLNSRKFRAHFECPRKTKEENGINYRLNFSKSKEFYSTFLLLKKWSILKSPAGSEWVTTDNPLRIDIKTALSGFRSIETSMDWIDVDANAMIYFPLSTEYCIRLEPLADEANCSIRYNNELSFEISTEQEVKVINNLALKPKANITMAGEREILYPECVCE